MTYILIFISAIILNFFLSKYFIKKNIVDHINHRSSHSGIATRSGGTVLVSIVFIYCTTLYSYGLQPFDYSILIPILLLYATGLYDDLYKVNYSLKFIFQIIVAKYLIDLGYVIDIFSIFGNEFYFSRQISQIVSIIVYVTIINAYNFIDGIDSNIHLETIKNLLLILFFFEINPSFFELIIILLLIMLANLIFNLKSKEKVFMGDSGSLILPILLIVLMFQSPFSGDQNIIKYLFLIFLYPITDLIRVVIIRLKNKKSPFLPDKNHIHHLINNKIESHLKSSIIIFSIVLILQLTLIFLIF
ncbi:MAG: hypothetical protein CMJ05_11100 [Pelagibacterales bacterium]|nr:hypothetical protein [Pelagibacterales bacterium]|tara:strand:+ start:3552 stop:4457 length:906 start_codon:yes stop_codon:yes gene_type:complete